MMSHLQMNGWPKHVLQAFSMYMKITFKIPKKTGINLYNSINRDQIHHFSEHCVKIMGILSFKILKNKQFQ